MSGHSSIPKASHPSPDKMREKWMNLNGEWDFSFDEPVFDRKITVPFSWASPLSGIGEDQAGTGWYRKKVVFDPQGKRVFLIVGAADYNCEVYINNQLAGAHQGGYQPIELDVTGMWYAQGANTVVIKVTDTDEKYQTYGKQGYGNIRGIWQTVYVECRPFQYIRRFTVRTSLLPDESALVEYRVWLSESVVGSVCACFGGVCGQVQVQGEEATLQLPIAKPQLWSPDSPYLYEGSLTFAPVGAGAQDVVQTYFGVRQIGAARMTPDGCKYITLNGKPIYINGTLDQSCNPRGFFTLPSDEEEKNEILRMKQLGLNAARIHIKSEEPLKLYWADKLGLLILQDIPCFWGEPTAKARELFEQQLDESILRDINHPSIFYWVVFNETWGLFSQAPQPDGSQKRVYNKNTQEWVRACYHHVKALDPTRLVEDNSACNQDHVETDVNTWHFYANGYKMVKENIDTYCSGAYPGSGFNFTAGNACGDVPLMNSECGNVWGVTGNAGDSDISWHYKYMMNEFRLHEKLSGFVFTEFHDVINEFNGYYRIDNAQKQFGYDAYVPGMSLKDLHAADFVCADTPPMRSFTGQQHIALPVFVSSFTDENHGKPMCLCWSVVYRCPRGCETVLQQGEEPVRYSRYGLNPVCTLHFDLPAYDGIFVLQMLLQQSDGQTVMRNFFLYDMQGENESGLRVPLTALQPVGFTRAWLLQQGSKLNAIGGGEVRFTVNKEDIPDYAPDKNISISFEASAKQELTKDRVQQEQTQEDVGLGYMLGYRVDRGKNPNSYYQTDETVFPAEISLYAENECLAEFTLPDAPADCAGCLSWHYQAADNLLDEAGSYGYLCRATIPAAVAKQMPGQITFTVRSKDNFSLYDRNSGRYPMGIRVKAVQLDAQTICR